VRCMCSEGRALQVGALLGVAVAAGYAPAAGGGAQILYGNLAPEGCVGKITGKEGLVFEGPARVFDCEEDMLAALSKNPESMKARAAPCSRVFFPPRPKSAALGPV